MKLSVSSDVLALALFLASAVDARAQAQTQPPGPPSMEIYGFGQADAIADFNQNDPNWFDLNRPSRLPSSPNQFGQDGRFYLSARQSRFGVRSTVPTSMGDVKANFEFDMFGTGKDAGLTTIRLRHAYGQFKQIGAGQTNSQFMDPDVFPNILDYWAPNGMLLFRNVQVFWEPYRNGDSHARLAVENPGATGDSGAFSDRVEVQNVTGRFPSPDFTGHYRAAASWGYVQIGGVLRYIAYDDPNANATLNLSGHVWGGGVSGSSNVKAGENDILRVQATYGAGIEKYFNDAPIDVGIEKNPGNPVTPLVGKALPVFGLMVYLDHKWNPRWATSAGYSLVDISNSDGQAPNAFRKGHYVSASLACTPVPSVIMSSELQWARRENFSDGFSVGDVRLQFSFRYSFAVKMGG
jgi:DcaP outer membrane protein